MIFTQVLGLKKSLTVALPNTRTGSTQCFAEVLRQVLRKTITTMTYESELYGIQYVLAKLFYRVFLVFFLPISLNPLRPDPGRVRARSLVVSDLRSENKGSRFESGC